MVAPNPSTSAIMLNYPTAIASPKSPTGVFIGDEHRDLVHVVQLTASISELVSHGIQVLFLEAFYSSEPPSGTDTASLAAYIRGRNFDHMARPKGSRELPICYNSLLQRCGRASLPVRGVDVRVPPDIANLKKGKAFRMVVWRSTTANDEWKANIEKQCQSNGWSKFALFGGRVHAKGLSNRFGDRITAQIWDRSQRGYIAL